MNKRILLGKNSHKLNRATHYVSTMAHGRRYELAVNRCMGIVIECQSTMIQWQNWFSAVHYAADRSLRWTRSAWMTHRRDHHWIRHSNDPKLKCPLPIYMATAWYWNEIEWPLILIKQFGSTDIHFLLDFGFWRGEIAGARHCRRLFDHHTNLWSFRQCSAWLKTVQKLNFSFRLTKIVRKSSSFVPYHDRIQVMESMHLSKFHGNRHAVSTVTGAIKCHCYSVVPRLRL